MARTQWTKQRVVDAILDCHRRGVPVDHIWRRCRTACVVAFKLFGSWREALAAAGLESSRQQWTRERVIQELKTRYLVNKDLRKGHDRLVAAADRYFGTWRQALLAAGLPVPKARPPQRQWTAPEVLAAIQSRQTQGLPITGVGREDPSLYAAARRFFGGWRHALCAAGLARAPRELLTAEQTVRAIQERHRQGLPLQGLQHQAPCLYNAAIRNFGGWRRALSAAGIESNPCQRWQQDRVIAAIRERHQQGLPLSRVWRDDKPLFRAAVNHFGNWQNAMQATGLEFKPRRKWSKEQILGDLRGWYCQGQSNIRHVAPGLAAAAARYFGSLENALEAASLDPPANRWTKRRIIEAIQDGYVRRLPLEIAGCQDPKLAAAAKRHFGTWRAAVEAAGLLPRLPPPVVQREWSAAAVIEAIRALSRQFPVPTYVVEFLLGRYCASTDPEEIDEGIKIVQRQLADRTVKAGEEELFKSHAREKGDIRIIDLISARLDAKTDSYLATLPSLRLNDVRISPEMVNQHERILTGGFYAEIGLSYDAAIAQEKNGRPFGVDNLREIQLSKRDVLDSLSRARAQFNTADWKTFLLRSIGIAAETLSERAKDAYFLRMVPFVERNFNLVELGPRGTGKSHLFQQVSPYAHLISGGKATVARMFVNMANGQRGLVCQYDVVCFDEVSGVSFDQKDGVNIMKGYMESGEFSRGKESIRADGSLVLVGNFEVDVEHQQRVGHLLGPLPPEMRDDTAFMDRIHAYLPGWDIPKVNKDLLTNHFGLVSDFLSECWRRLRDQSRVSVLQGRVYYGGALSGRDTNAVNKTVSGLLKLMYPGGSEEVPDEDLEWAIRIALECRRRVKEQQKRIGAAEFRNTHFSYVLGNDGVERFVSTPELQSEGGIGADPLEPGQVWTITPGGMEENPGLYRIEVNEGPGSGVKVLNKPVPPAFRESVGYAEQNLYARATQLVGDKDPRQHEFTVQLRAFDASKSGAKLGVALLVSLCTALLKKPTRGGLIIVGEINLGGSIEPIHNATTVAEIAVEKGASALLMPVACRRQLFDLSDDMATKVDIQFYSDARDALLKAIQE